jgi:hypothetical protein
VVIIFAMIYFFSLFEVLTMPYFSVLFVHQQLIPIQKAKAPELYLADY